MLCGTGKHPNINDDTQIPLELAKEGHPLVRKRAYFRWLIMILILVRALELCGTGKHPNINVETQIPLELAKMGHTPVRKRAYFRWLIMILVRALELCGTGKHPNINIETQIPLELHTLHAVFSKVNKQTTGQDHWSPHINTSLSCKLCVE